MHKEQKKTITKLTQGRHFDQLQPHGLDHVGHVYIDKSINRSGNDISQTCALHKAWLSLRRYQQISHVIRRLLVVTSYFM